jgi:hypothetical protein
LGLVGGRLQGDTIYFDERNRSSVGTFNLGRTGTFIRLQGTGCR